MSIADFLTFPGQFTIRDWQESVAMYSPNQYQLTRKKSYCELSGYVPWEKFKSAQQYFLGYSWVDDSTGSLKIGRALPAYHPIFNWLYCSGITKMQGVRFDGKQDDLFYEPAGLSYATYQYVLFTVSYEPYPYDIVWDFYLNGPYEGWECDRYTTILPAPYTELYTLESGNFVYTAPSKPWHDTAIPSRQCIARSEKNGLKMTWYEVPYEYVFDENDNPTKLMKMEKTVNSIEFKGRPAQTLLCDKINVEKYTAPLASDITDYNAFMCDITFELIYTNPTPALETETLRGHQLVLAADGKYYGARNRINTDPATNKLYRETNFYNAFTAVLEEDI